MATHILTQLEGTFTFILNFFYSQLLVTVVWSNPSPWSIGVVVNHVWRLQHLVPSCNNRQLGISILSLTYQHQLQANNSLVASISQALINKRFLTKFHLPFNPHLVIFLSLLRPYKIAFMVDLLNYAILGQVLLNISRPYFLAPPSCYL